MSAVGQALTTLIGPSTTHQLVKCFVMHSLIVMVEVMFLVLNIVRLEAYMASGTHDELYNA